MTFGVIVLALAFMAIGLLSLFFIFCRRYEDGYVGNLALGAMALASVIELVDIFDASLLPYEAPSPAICLLILGVAVFMGRHAWRFAMFHWHGRFGWKAPADVRQRIQ